MEEFTREASAGDSWRSDLCKTLLWVVAWLLLINAFAWIAVNRFNLAPDTSFIWFDPLKFSPRQTADLVDLHVRWDGPWLVDLAKNGYHRQPDDDQSNLNFFPLYPLAMRLGGMLLGGHYALAGCIASVGFLIGALLSLRKLLREQHPEIEVDRVHFYLLIFPTAFALNAVYTESLFLLLSVLTFLHLGREKYFRAGFFGMLAALTRPLGFLLAVPMAWELFRRYRFGILRRRELFSILLPPLGTTLFFFYNYLKFGNFFTYLKAQSHFGRMLFRMNTEHYILLTNPAVVNFALDVVYALFAFAGLYLVWKRKWYSYASYVAATLGIILLTGTLVGIARYTLVLFPIFIALASIKSRLFDRIYTLASAILLAFSITLFVNWYWGM